MKAAVATCKDDIFPPEAANNGGSQHTAHSPECALSCQNLNLGVSRTPHDYVTVRLRQNAQACTGLTPTVVRLSDRV